MSRAVDSLNEFAPALTNHFSSVSFTIWLPVILLCIIFCAPYACFQLRLLPNLCGKFIGRAYFYPCLLCTLRNNRKHWWAYVDEGGPGSPPILLGAAPIRTKQLRELDLLGVKAVVNLCDEYKGPAKLYKRNGVALLWLRTIDHCEPTVEAMRTAVSFIEHHRGLGNAVYIHCKAGRGRAAAIAMAWLMQINGLPPLAANHHLLSARKVRPTLFLQKNVIRFFEEECDEESAAAPRGAAPVRKLSYATSGPGGLGDNPPDWNSPPATGAWEVNVAPVLAQAQPEDELPDWSQQEKQQFDAANERRRSQLDMQLFGAAYVQQQQQQEMGMVQVNLSGGYQSRPPPPPPPAAPQPYFAQGLPPPPPQPQPFAPQPYYAQQQQQQLATAPDYYDPQQPGHGQYDYSQQQAGYGYDQYDYPSYYPGSRTSHRGSVHQMNAQL